MSNIPSTHHLFGCLDFQMDCERRRCVLEPGSISESDWDQDSSFPLSSVKDCSPYSNKVCVWGWSSHIYGLWNHCEFFTLLVRHPELVREFGLIGYASSKPLASSLVGSFCTWDFKFWVATFSDGVPDIPPRFGFDFRGIIPAGRVLLNYEVRIKIMKWKIVQKLKIDI